MKFPFKVCRRIGSLTSKFPVALGCKWICWGRLCDVIEISTTDCSQGKEMSLNSTRNESVLYSAHRSLRILKTLKIKHISFQSETISRFIKTPPSTFYHFDIFIFFQVWKMMMRSAGCNVFSVITSRLESSVVIWPPRSLGNDAFDIYSRGTSIPDALVVCTLFYWAWWVSLSLLLSSMADSVSTAIYPPDSTRSTIDQMVDVSWRWHRGRHSHRL